MQAVNNSIEWNNWIEEAISKRHIKYYEYKDFYNIEKIGKGAFAKVYRANWKNSEQYFALKSIFNLDNVTIKEAVNELELQRQVDYHENIIRFLGITAKENQNDKSKKYSLVMEYADGGTLRTYLVNNKKLTWEDKYKLAYQLACAVLCLHDERIVHCDLHSGNILIRQNTIKLTDFGLSKKIGEVSKTNTNIFGVIPYIDPKKLIDSNYSLNEKSDVYSVGVLLWEISANGRSPFKDKPHVAGLVIQILNGLREKVVPGTPEDYAKIYTDCWNGEPDNRLTINEVVPKLKEIIARTTMEIKIGTLLNDNFNVDVSNINNISQEGISQMIVIQNYEKIKDFSDK